MHDAHSVQRPIGLQVSLTVALATVPRLGVEGTSAYRTCVDTSSSPVMRFFMLRMNRMSYAASISTTYIQQFEA